MPENQKLGNLAVQVPVHGSGNVIRNLMVDFDVWKEDNSFKAVPLCSKEERIIASLPEELRFDFQEGKVVSPRGLKEGNMHVINEIFYKMKEKQLV